MGMYVSVRGWLQVDHKQRQLVEQTIAKYDDGLYSGGWAFPAHPFNWTLYVFYGGDIREVSVASFREQVAELARLEPADEDLDMPAGFFLLSDDRQQPTSWTIRDGQLVETPAPEELHWFAGRP